MMKVPVRISASRFATKSTPMSDIRVQSIDIIGIYNIMNARLICTYAMRSASRLAP